MLCRRASALPRPSDLLLTRKHTQPHTNHTVANTTMVSVVILEKHDTY